MDLTGLARNVAAGTSAEVLRVVVPNRSRMRIAAIGFTAQDPAALVYARWSLLDGSTPLFGYGNIAAAIGSLEEPAPMSIVVDGPAQVRLMITNEHAGGLSTWTYVARLTGWIWSVGSN